jgi:hypothetical protein
MRGMAPKHHPAPLSGGDRKALKKEFVKSRAMAGILAERSEEKRRLDEALIREADNLACQSWNEKMWSDGGPIDPLPLITAALRGWRSNALDTRRRAMAIYACCPTSRRHACTISPGGWFVRSAGRPASGRSRHCSSLRRARVISRRPGRKFKAIYGI